MKMLMLLASSVLMLTSAVAGEKETRFFEMRTYYAAPGKLDALLSRFRDHTTALFARHGIVNIGYWLPLTNTENKLVYLLAYGIRVPDRLGFFAGGDRPTGQPRAGV